MTTKQYDLEERTFTFAKDVRAFVRNLMKDIPNSEDAKQLVRASGLVGANYIEANEALSKKDFIMRAKICRKEAKESGYWLRLIETLGDASLEEKRMRLQNESSELTSIFGAIIRNSESVK